MAKTNTAGDDKACMRLQKWLAQQGLASRRTIESWISAGRITINQQTAKLGDKVTSEDAIHLDGKPVIVSIADKTRLLLLNKASKVICSHRDTHDRPTVYDALPSLAHGRWLSVGRLDYHTEGLLLVTNDGELAARLMHPRSALAREYHVRCFGDIEASVLARIRAGIKLKDGWIKPERLEKIAGDKANSWYRIVLAEGRNRIVRRIWGYANVRINRLKRVRYGSLGLPADLPVGSYVELAPKAIKALASSITPGMAK